MQLNGPNSIPVFAAFLAALAVSGTAASAQVDLTTPYRPAADACYEAAAEAGDLGRCDGLLSQACMDREPGGMSTQGMAACLRAEYNWWDEKLNLEYRAAMGQMRAMDDADEAVGFPEFALRAERLRAAQRAWIAFRDADCALQYALPGPGTIRSLYGPGCLSARSFERVQQLIHLQETMP